MRSHRTAWRCASLLLAACLWATTATGACILPVPQHYQVMDQWCWAATSQSVLEFYGTVLSQAEIAAYGTDGANIPNYICGTSSSPTRRGVNMILDHFAGIVTTWGFGALSKSDLTADVCANLPPVILWTWDSGGGHIVAIRGVDDDSVHLMDPWYGPTINTYDWVCRGRAGHHHGRCRMQRLIHRRRTRLPEGAHRAADPALRHHHNARRGSRRFRLRV